jgi:hypothetical protein
MMVETYSYCPASNSVSSAPPPAGGEKKAQKMKIVGGFYSGVDDIKSHTTRSAYAETSDP